MSTWGAPEDGADRNADRSTDEGIISFLVASTRGSRYSASRKVLGARLSGSFGLGAVRQLLLSAWPSITKRSLETHKVLQSRIY
jgi:hypothetical protein